MDLKREEQMYRFLPFLFFIISGQLFAQDLSSTGLQISVAGDIVYDQSLSSESEAEDKMTMRGAEFMFYAPVDHNFDAVLSAAAHDELGKTQFELHELFLESSRLLPKSNIKMGQFFLGVGRINRFHQHDWPFTRAPKVHRTFFAKEGVFDSGVEFSRLLPKYSQLTLGLTSGHSYGHSHTAGAKPKAPTHYLRLSKFFLGRGLSGLDVGFNFLGRTDAQDNKMQLIGLDLTAKDRVGKVLKQQYLSELWYKTNKNASKEIVNQVGMYLFHERNYSDQIDLGFRIDVFKDLSKKNALNGKKINNISYGLVTQSTYTSSEFAKIRLSLSHEFTKEEGITSFQDTRLQMQLIFILGSHPAHDF